MEIKEITPQVIIKYIIFSHYPLVEQTLLTIWFRSQHQLINNLLYGGLVLDILFNY